MSNLEFYGCSFMLSHMVMLKYERSFLIISFQENPKKSIMDTFKSNYLIHEENCDLTFVN